SWSERHLAEQEGGERARFLTRPVRRSSLYDVLCAVLLGLPQRAPAVLRPRRDHTHRSVRLLLAEDNLINQRVIRYLIEREGCAYTLVENGLRAVEAFAEGDYDMILMDCQMPELDGFEATRQIRALPGGRDVPIVAMTALAFKEDRGRCLDAGMSDYLAKPLTRETLAPMLDRWLGPIDQRGAG
ncbi:MAG: two-component system sensor histidine kinase/response regulator, partial [Myxococcota bacterium]